MVTKKEIIEDALNFYKYLSGLDKDRYMSWEHCYKKFYDAVTTKKYDIKELALNLGFYLASWGMYRGSSFLLHFDYLIHIEAVKIILNEKYKGLLGLSCLEFDHEKIKLLFALKKELNDYYQDFRKQAATKRDKDKPTNDDVSKTLITKVILGTLGCSPAYDSLFCEGLKFAKKEKSLNINIIKNFNENSIEQICEFVKAHKSLFNNIQNDMKLKNQNICYPDMKIIDMVFWFIGWNLGKILKFEKDGKTNDSKYIELFNKYKK